MVRNGRAVEPHLRACSGIGVGAGVGIGARMGVRVATRG